MLSSLSATSYEITFVSRFNGTSQSHPDQGISLLRFFSPKLLSLLLEQRHVSDEVVGGSFEYARPGFLLGLNFDQELVDLVDVFGVVQVEKRRELFVDVFVPVGHHVEH